MFWGKRKPVVLNCYTCRPDVFNFFPIVSAKQKIPAWFKKLPTPYYKGLDDNVQNLKLCPAVVELFCQGFLLPLWSDLFLEIGKAGTENYRWQYSDRKSDIQVHPARDWGDEFPTTKYQHLKLDSPWFFECEEDIRFLATSPEWQFDTLDGIHILSGVLGFNAQGTTNINMFARRDAEVRKKIIPCGTPIYQFIPLTDRKVVLKTHLISKNELERKQTKSTRVSFIRHYQKKLNLFKNKCPYTT